MPAENALVPSPREVAERFVAACSDLPKLADLYAPRVVIEMPFAPPSFPTRMECTREELRARFTATAQVRRYEEVDSVAIHETADPEVVIVEYGVQGTVLATGKQFALRFVLVMTVRDGVIVHSRDYSDPIAGARLLGMTDRLVEALTAQEG